MIRQKSWIDEANTKISIVDVLTTIGIAVPTSIRSSGSKKIFCPFGFYHSDGGLTKAMRVYFSSNNVYCFSCSKRYSPVGLASAFWDCSWNNAALRLLDEAGFKAKTLDERWAEATMAVENKPDLIALAEALKMYCSSIDPTWSIDQYSDDISIKLNKCLSLLDSVRSPEDADKWLNICKSVMKKSLEE